jgi:hypothetical protein
MKCVMIAIALLCCSCATDQPFAAGESLSTKAERFVCSKDELTQMDRYFSVCMQGTGYISSYCLDRSVVATCHETGSGGAT